MTDAIEQAMRAEKARRYQGDPAPSKGEIDRFEDHEDLDVVLPEHDLTVTQILTPDQIKILNDDIPLDQVRVRKFGGKPVAYLTIGWYLKQLNDLVGRGNWRLEVTKREQIRSKHGILKEVYVEGRLVLTSMDGSRTVAIDTEGGAIVRDNPNSTLADSFKKARSDAVKNAAQWFGIGLRLKTKDFQQKAVEHHGHKWVEDGN